MIVEQELSTELEIKPVVEPVQSIEDRCRLISQVFFVVETD
jgi:hypothetical protein